MWESSGPAPTHPASRCVNPNCAVADQGGQELVQAVRTHARGDQQNVAVTDGPSEVPAFSSAAGACSYLAGRCELAGASPCVIAGIDAHGLPGTGNHGAGEGARNRGSALGAKTQRRVLFFTKKGKGPPFLFGIGPVVSLRRAFLFAGPCRLFMRQSILSGLLERLEVADVPAHAPRP